MKFSSLLMFCGVCTVTASSLGTTVVYSVKNSFDNSVLRLEKKIFYKFKKSWDDLFRKLQKDIIETIYNNPSKIPEDFFVKKKDSTGSSTSSISSSESASQKATQETDEQKINKLFLKAVDDTIPSFLSSFAFYQSDLQSQNNKDDPSKLRDHFFIQILYYLQNSLQDLDALTKEMEKFVETNKSTSSWKFMLNKKYFDFLKDFCISAAEIFQSIEEFDEFTDLIKNKLKFSDYSGFLDPKETTFNIQDSMKKIKELLTHLNFEEKDKIFANYYEDFTFTNSQSEATKAAK